MTGGKRRPSIRGGRDRRQALLLLPPNSRPLFPFRSGGPASSSCRAIDSDKIRSLLLLQEKALLAAAHLTLPSQPAPPPSSPYCVPSSPSMPSSSPRAKAREERQWLEEEGEASFPPLPFLYPGTTNSRKDLSSSRRHHSTVRMSVPSPPHEREKGCLLLSSLTSSSINDRPFLSP